MSKGPKSSIVMVFSFVPAVDPAGASFAHSARLSALLGGPIADAARQGLEVQLGPQRDTQLWLAEDLDLAPEFSPSFQAVFRRRGGAQGLGSDLWCMSQAGLDVVNGGAAPHGGFRYAWQGQVRKRLDVADDAAVTEHRFRIAAITARRYSSGVTQLTLRIDAAPAACARPATALIELAFALEHATRLDAYDQRIAYSKASAGATSFAAWTRWLLAQVGDQPVEARRAFIAVAAQGHDPAAEGMTSGEFALRLARQHTTDYAVTADAIGGVYAPFRDIHIATYSEGAAWVVDAGGAPFLEGYAEHTWPRSGLPMCALALHERTMLLALADAAEAPERDSRDDAQHMHRLEDVWDRFVRFRLNYRIDEISTITHHKRQYENLRAAFGIDALGATVDRDLAAATAHLERRLQHRRDHRARLLVALVSVLGTALVILHVADVVLRLLYGHPMQLELAKHWLAANPAGLAKYKAAMDAEAFWTIVTMLGAVVVASAAYWLSGRRPPGH